jgi:hypothetical protein
MRDHENKRFANAVLEKYVGRYEFDKNIMPILL